MRAYSNVPATPHPYPLPVNNGERGTSTLTPPSASLRGVRFSVPAAPYPLPLKNWWRGTSTLTPPSPRFSRGEGKGEGLAPVPAPPKAHDTIREVSS